MWISFAENNAKLDNKNISLAAGTNGCLSLRFRAFLPVMHEAGLQGVQAHPQKLRFVENPDKIPEYLGKIPENLGKIPENLIKIPKYLGKILENMCKNGAQHGLTSKNSAQRLQKNKWRL